MFIGRWLSVIGLGGFGPALVFVLVCSLYIWQNFSSFSVILHVKEVSSLWYKLDNFLPDQSDQDQLDQDIFYTISVEERRQKVRILTLVFYCNLHFSFKDQLYICLELCLVSTAKLYLASGVMLLTPYYVTFGK